MMIEINKDIGEMKESVFLGLTARQTIYSLVGLAVGSIGVWKLYPYVGYYISVIAVFPVTVPIFLQGFYQFQGMSFFDYGKALYRQFRERKKEYFYEEETEEDS